MATDSTELTFVRCPSCRSLVPAVSTRCRMCGASLDAASKPDAAATDPRKSGRVRQRTMSAPRTPLNEVAEEIRKAESPEAPFETGAEQDLTGEDPLGAYIEEVEVTESDAEPIENGNGYGAHKEVEDEEDALETEAAIEDEQEDAPSYQAPEVKAQEPEPTFEPAVEEPRQAEPVNNKPRVILESGGRRSGRPSGLQFGNKAKEEPRKEAAYAPPAATTQPVQIEESAPKRTFDAAPEWRPEPEITKAPEAPQRQAREVAETREAPPVRQEVRQPAKSERTQVAAPSEGRLFGWLVSYKNPSGEAIELREGRFFVTGSPLKPNDLLLKDASVSTPHAMVTVGADSGFVVRDLMSEHGISVKRRDAGSYERAGEETAIRHGDWIKFGQVEFLVTLVAHVGIK